MLFCFQVYNVTIWYILQNYHHNKSGEHPSLEIVTIVFLWWKFLLSLCRSALAVKDHAEACWWGVTPHQGQGQWQWVPGCEGTGADERSYPTSEVRGSGRTGQMRATRGATPSSRSGGAAVRRYPWSKVRSSGCALLGQPWRDTPYPR